VIVEAGGIHVLAPHVKERFQWGFNALTSELEVNLPRRIVRVELTHGTAAVVQTHISRNWNLFTVNVNLHDGVVVILKVVVAPQALLCQGMSLIGGREQRAAVAFTEQHTQGNQ